MGQSISDAFYPDNPNRRARAEQLSGDIRAFATSYEETKRARDELLKEIGPRLATVLKKEGYNTPEELDAKVQSILTGEHLAEYLKVREKHDKNSQLESTIFSICSYISIGTGVFLGGLFLLGFITGGAAWAVLGGVALALAAVGAVLALFAVFEGAKERSDLRTVIQNLGPERVKARRAMVLMQAISNWARYIKIYLDTVVTRQPSMAAEMWEGDLKAEFAQSEHDAVVKWLVDYDRERGAWTNEDGDWRTNPDTSHARRLVTMGAFSRTVQTGVQQPKVVVQHEGEKSLSEGPISMTVLETGPSLCIAQDDKGEKWSLVTESITQKDSGATLSINNSLFSLKRLANGEVLHNFRVVEFTPVL